MSLRTIFDEDAELYDRARPTYPAELFDDLVRLLPGRELLEIGCGTGQATLALAERGFEVTCVELGANLSAVARRNLAAFPPVTVITADFDTWESDARFDAVLSFTAFHWLDPETRFHRVAHVLRAGGVLGVVHVTHVAGGDDFFVEVQHDYRSVLPDDPPSHVGGPPAPESVAGLAFDELLFERIAHLRYLWEIEYGADAYIDVLSTYSNHRALDEQRRDELLARIRRRIEPRGTVRKTYLATLDVARLK